MVAGHTVVPALWVSTQTTNTLAPEGTTIVVDSVVGPSAVAVMVGALPIKAICALAWPLNNSSISAAKTGRRRPTVRKKFREWLVFILLFSGRNLIML